MKCGLRGAGLLILIALILPVANADDKKDDIKKVDPKAKAEEKKKDDDKKTEPKDKDEEKKSDSEKKPESKTAADSKDKWLPVAQVNGQIVKFGSQKLTCAVQKAYPKGNKIEFRSENVDFETAESVVVRVAQPPTAFDEKGRPKRYTAKELAEFKGPDKKMPGYNADLESVKPGQYVQLFLAKKKSAPKNDPPLVTLIFIVKDASNP